MKKVLFLAVTLMLSLSSAAQGYYVSNDDYIYTINDGIVLTGEQWHTNDASILAANNSQYLVVRGPTREYHLLRMFSAYDYERIWGRHISHYKPYYHFGCLGWYVVAGLVDYFIFPDGRWCRLATRPHYYSYHYHVAHCRHINFYDWHFWLGHSRHDFHGKCYHKPHKHYRAPQNNYHYKKTPVHDKRHHNYTEKRKPTRINNDNNRHNKSSVYSERNSNTRRAVNSVERKPSNKKSSSGVRSRPNRSSSSNRANKEHYRR